MCLSYRHELALLRVTQGRDGERMDFAEPGVGPHYGPDRQIAIEHIDVHLVIDPEAKKYSGEAWIRFRPLPAFDGTVALDLDEVVVDSVRDLQGADLDWVHDDATLTVRKVTAPGTVVVRWHVENPRRGMYFTGPTAAEPARQHMAWTQCQDEDAHFLLPCHDHPGTKHAWAIELEGPKGYTLLSNGAAIESGVRNDRAFARFAMTDAMPAYLFTAVCAKLTVHEAEWRGRAVRYFAPIGEDEAVMRSMGRTPEMMELFATRTGTEFPWPRYDQVVVHDFIFGGMENTGCTTMTRALLVDAKAAIDWDAESLVSHELAHQWFGDLVTCQDWSQGWLNESWATFMETVWTESSRGEAEGTWYVYEQARSYFEEDSGRYRRPIVAYNFREPIDVFDRHLYEKGGCVLHTLRHELGDVAFWAGVRHYLERHGKQTVHTRHFQRALEESTGRNLDRFFADWVHSAGHPVVEVKLGREDGLVTVAVKQTQHDDGAPFVYHLPLRLEIRTRSGRIETVDLKLRERERTFAIPMTEDVETVRVDPGFRFLAKLSLEGPRGWLEALLADSCPVLASRAARALLDEGSTAAFDAVVRAMGDHPFFGVRGELAAMLGKRGGADARDALLRTFDGERDPRARRRIAEALGHFREAVVADKLIEILGGLVETWHLTGAALVSLGKTRDPRAIETITAHLDTPSWVEFVTQRGLDGLAATEDPAVKDTLNAYSRPDHRDRVRAAAARAMGHLADKVESVRPVLVERLIEMTNEPGFRAQIATIAALGDAKDASANAALERLHRSAPDGRTRRNAYEALVQIRHGRTTGDALAGLRKRVEELAEENHKLRMRVEKIEPVQK
jgi:aminopeptidase N